MDKQKFANFYVFIGLFSIFLLLSLCVLTFFNVVDYRIIDMPKLDGITEILSSIFLFSINIMFLIRFCLNLNYLKTIKFTLIYIPIYVISVVLEMQLLLITAFLPNVYILIICAYLNILALNKIINMIVFNAVIVITEIGLMYIRSVNFDFYDIKISTLQSAILSIDLFLQIIYLERSKINEKSIKRLARQLMVFPKSFSFSKNFKLCQEILGFEELTGGQKLLFKALVLAYQLIQLLIIVALAIIYQRFNELIYILFFFWIGRIIATPSWHSDNLDGCFWSTIGSFYMLIRCTPSFGISIFLLVLCAALFVYILHILAIKKERLSELELKYENDFTIYGLTQYMADFAYDYKVEKLSIKEQALKLGLPVVVIKNYRTKVNKAINKGKIIKK